MPKINIKGICGLINYEINFLIKVCFQCTIVFSFVTYVDNSLIIAALVNYIDFSKHAHSSKICSLSNKFSLAEQQFLFNYHTTSKSITCCFDLNLNFEIIPKNAEVILNKMF